jgi:hypothetical protein
MRRMGVIRPSDVAHALEPVLGRIDPRKAAQVAALVELVRHQVTGAGRSRMIVDVACGKSYLVHALAALVRPRARYVGIDRDPSRIAHCTTAARKLGLPEAAADFRVGSVDALTLDVRPDVMMALHACGDATDQAIERAIATRARHVFIVPCCHRRPSRSVAIANGLPTHGVLRGRLTDALADSRRALRLETGGFEVVAVEFVTSAVTPHNLLLRGRFVGVTARIDRAHAALERLAQLTPACGAG